MSREKITNYADGSRASQLTDFWTCQNCDWKGVRPGLDEPIMHETINAGHKTNPTFKAAIAWKGVLGK